MLRCEPLGSEFLPDRLQSSRVTPKQFIGYIEESAREQGRESESIGESKRLYADVQEAQCVQPQGLISQIRHLNPRHFRAVVLSLAAH